MTEIRRVLRVAAWRLFAIDLARTLAVTLSAVIVALIALRLAQQLLGLGVTEGQWWRAGIGAVGSAVIAAVIWSAARRARGVAVARELDERANLRESLSTALCVEKSDDPWAQAVVETARQRATGLKAGAAIPITAPRMWPVPAALAIAFGIAWMVPQVDLFGRAKERRADLQREQEIQQVKAEVKTNEEKLKELARQAGVELKDEKPDDAGAAPEPQNPDDIRRAAVKKLTSMQEKLAELKNGEKAQKMEALKQALKQLKQPGPGPLDELSKSLAKGDFNKAQQELEELSKKLASDSMSKEEKEQAKQQLAKLAEQLDKLAKAKAETEKRLEQAGMSKEDAKKLAADPEALKKALEQMKNLSEEQKQQLMEMAKAQSEAGKQCEGMAGELGKMARGMGEKGMDGEGMEGMEAFAGQLSELEQLGEEMESLDSAMSECLGQLAGLSECMGQGEGESLAGMMGIRPWSEGSTDSSGPGSGGPGHGNGPSTKAEESAIATTKEKSPTKLGAGPIIGSRLVQGDQVRGESAAEFSEAVEVGASAATEALETMTIPREYHDAVKTYFGRLQAKTRASSPAAPPAEPADGK